MRKIIDGRRYDTTARNTVCVGSAKSHRAEDDFYYWEASLYRTQHGRYFLAGSGGAMSRFGQSVGRNNFQGGEDLIPLTYDEALLWAGEHLTKAEVARGFLPK